MNNPSRHSRAARHWLSKAWRRIGVFAVLLMLALPAMAQDAGEIEFWKSVQNSKNPAELKAYLESYPNGRFAPLARLRLGQLTGSTPPAAAAQQPQAPTAKEEAPSSPASSPAAPGSESTASETAPVVPEPPKVEQRLTAAIRAGNVEAVKAAVAGGADVNAWDEQGLTPIGLAALLGKPDIITLLAASGADVNRNDRYGFTPLMNAAIRGQPEAARILLALGANPTMKGGNGNDPLGAARPNGPTDRRYGGKLAVEKILEAAMASQ